MGTQSRDQRARTRRGFCRVAWALLVLPATACSHFGGDGTYYGYYYIWRDTGSRVRFSKSSGIITAEPAVATTIEVSLEMRPDDSVTITQIASSDTTEVTVAPDSLTFTVDNFDTPQTLTLTGVDDAVADGPQRYSIRFGPTQSTDAFYAHLPIGELTGQNSDEDGAGINVNPTAGHTTTEAAGTSTFTVVLNSEPVADVTIPLSVDDTTEAAVAPASLVFTAANWNVAQTVTITGQNDDLDDGNQAFTVLVQPATSADPVYNGRDGTDVTGSNTDNDAVGVTVTSDACGLFTYEAAGAPTTFTVRLNSEPTADVTIPVASSNTNEATVSPANLTFTSSDWSTDQTVTVTGVDGFGGAGNDVAYNINLGAAASADGGYNGLVIASVSGINLHNDSFGVAVRSTCQDTSTSEGGGTGTFYATLRSQPTADVVVTVSSSDTTEGTVGSTYTFTNADWFTRQSVTITGANDDIDDGDIAFSLSFTGASADGNYNGGLTGSLNLTNVDNDTAALVITPVVPPLPLTTTEAGGTAQFTVRLATEPTAAVSVSFASTDGTEGAVTAGSPASFDNTNWSVPQTITVTGQPNDGDSLGTTPYAISVNTGASADAVYAGLVVGNISATNDDN